MDGCRPEYIRSCRIFRSQMFDFIHKTLIIELTDPMTVLSTLGGWRNDIRAVGNHYFPAPCWSVSHHMGLDAFRKHVYKILERSPARTALLFTGADMDNLAVESATYKDLTVWALVTAGVKGNALRMSRDSGFFYEPGTINILLLASRRLTSRAMSRTLITATEAKTAALLNLDIRSCRAEGRYRATGTGTDNIIVVEGSGPAIENAGGHTKLGELIARTVHQAVTRAVDRQNHISAGRSLFQRLEERGLTVDGLVNQADCPCIKSKGKLAGTVEKILLDSKYAGFIELAMTISDDYEKGLISDLTAFSRLADRICRQIAGGETAAVKPLLESDQLPQPLQTGFNALFSGAAARLSQKDKTRP